MPKAPDPIDAIARLRQLLGEWRDASNPRRGLFPEVLALLQVVEDGLNVMRPAPGPESKKPPRGIGVVGYRVETGPRGQFLAEIRPKATPFRCDRPLFDAVAAALSNAKGGLHFEEVMAAVEKQLHSRPAEYAPRTALRFLSTGASPLLRRGRARYYPISPQSIRHDATRLWESYAKHGKIIPIQPGRTR